MFILVKKQINVQISKLAVFHQYNTTKKNKIQEKKVVILLKLIYNNKSIIKRGD